MLQGSSEVILSVHHLYHPPFHFDNMRTEGLSAKVKFVGGAATQFLDGGVKMLMPVLHPIVFIFELLVSG